MPSFSPIRDVPQQGTTEWQYAMLSAMKENIELLTGQRSTARAVTNDSVNVALASMNLKQVTAQGKGFATSGGNCAQYEDYVQLYQNVITLANDLYNTQQVLNTLIQQLKS